MQASLEALDGLALGAREELYIVNGNQVFRLEGGALTPFAGVSPDANAGAPGEQNGDGAPL